MNVEHICKYLQKSIKQYKLIGVVHSVFDNALNIITPDSQFITVLSSNKPMARNALKLSDNVSFIQLGIEAGMKISFYDRYAWIEELNITFDYENALVWDSFPVFATFKDNQENVNRKINVMKEFLVKEGNVEGILSLLSTLEERFNGFGLTLKNNHTLSAAEKFIKERFLDFFEAFISEQTECIGDKVVRVIGFGPGLTPSIDDFISGLMISRVYLFDYLHKDLNEAIDFNLQMIKKIDGKTTKISEEMLKLSAIGEVNENIRNLMLSFTSDAPIDKLALNLNVVASYGETSGTDIICGIYIGSKVLLNQFNRR